ncbi:carbonic anhydrase family protein [Lutibacter sp.]
MNTKIKLLGIVFVSTIIFSCTTKNEKQQQVNKQQDLNPPVETILTAKTQAELTPESILQDFIEGNERFMKSDLTLRNHSEQLIKSIKGQYPKAVILSCIDSRVPVENIFDQGIGDVFVTRVAGNFVNEDILGSMEYSCKVAGSKLIVVMGHEYCGAVKAAIDDVKLGNITAMLSKIKPAVENSQEYAGEKKSKNLEFVEIVVKNNVTQTINEVKQNSPILKEMLDANEIKIVGAYFNIQTGKVDFME